ncbi:MAG TPA: SCP2 sterol-binding domain-containing protein [Candidatus Binataceae bacterium]|nr:SCP2 sterol-binding domain-containing protein [Candidatus Binataceae bacterium]
MPDAPSSCKQVFEQMPSHFNKQAAQGLNAVYQFDLSGEGGGKWQVLINNDNCEIKEGAHQSPNTTISMTAQDYLDMVAGKLNPQMAFMSGKLRISGDMGLALRFQGLFG